MSNEGDSFKAAATLIFVGCGSFYQGLRSLKLRRKMLDIPTSKIASAAVGNFVEIQGKVYGERENQIESPLSGEKAAAFSWELYRRVQSGKRAEWVKIHTYYSTPFLYLQDDSADDLAVLDLVCCEFQEEEYSTTISFDDRSFVLPTAVQRILQEKGILDFTKKGSFLFHESYKLKERIFTRGQELYVLGTAVSPPEKEKTFRKVAGESFGFYNPVVIAQINQSVHEGRNNLSIVSQYDTNGDSILDRKETERLRYDVEKNFLSTRSARNFNDCLKNTRICFTKSDNNEKFFSIKEVIVSKHPEASQSLKLMSSGIFMIIGGPIAVVLGLWIMINNY